MQAGVSHRVGRLLARSQFRRLAAVTAPRRLASVPTTRNLTGTSALAGSFAFLSLTGAIPVVSCDEAAPTDEELQKGWDEFYAKSIQPGEDDDDDDEDEDEDEGKEEEEESGEPEEGEGGESGEPKQEMEVESTEKDQEKVKIEQSENEKTDDEIESESTGLLTSEDSSENVNADDDDKYENLPDEDEPTSCSICRINRQGPCRALWRKFETCMKDKITDEPTDESVTPGLAERCDKYMMPWISCFQQHRNFYTLITNQMYQFEYLDDVEAAVPEKQKRTMQDPDIDWAGYLKFIEDNDLSIGDFVVAKKAVEIGPPVSESLEMKLKSVAEAMKERGVEFKDEILKFGDGDDPKGLCDCQATVALKDPETQHPIEVAYARDQDGNILGFDMFTSAKKEGEDVSAMNFSVRFGPTEEVTIYAIYQPEAKEGNTVNNSEKRLYCSRPMSIFVPVREAGLLKPLKPIPIPKGLVGQERDKPQTG